MHAVRHRYQQPFPKDVLGPADVFSMVIQLLNVPPIQPNELTRQMEESPKPLPTKKARSRKGKEVVRLTEGESAGSAKSVVFAWQMAAAFGALEPRPARWRELQYAIIAHFPTAFW